jgi:hypothetical protein
MTTPTPNSTLFPNMDFVPNLDFRVIRVDIGGGPEYGWWCSPPKAVEAQWP